MEPGLNGVDLATKTNKVFTESYTSARVNRKDVSVVALGFMIATSWSLFIATPVRDNN